MTNEDSNCTDSLNMIMEYMAQEIIRIDEARILLREKFPELFEVKND